MASHGHSGRPWGADAREVVRKSVEAEHNGHDTEHQRRDRGGG